MEVAVGVESCVRREATDAHLTEVLATGITLLGIAGGFGAYGRDATNALTALTAIRDYLRRRQRLGMIAGKVQSAGALRTLLLHAFEHANERLYMGSGSTDDYVASGVSVTAALVVGHHAFIGHVGDGRAYVLRLGRLELMTVDDTIFASVPTTSKRSAPSRSRVRGVLWRSLGSQPRLEAAIAHVELLPGDQLLLCTDGMYRAVFTDEIGRALAQGDTASDVATRLLTVARARGTIENATVLVGRDLLTLDAPTPDPHGGMALWGRLGMVAAAFGAIAAGSWALLHAL